MVAVTRRHGLEVERPAPPRHPVSHHAASGQAASGPPGRLRPCRGTIAHRVAAGESTRGAGRALVQATSAGEGDARPAEGVQPELEVRPEGLHRRRLEPAHHTPSPTARARVVQRDGLDHPGAVGSGLRNKQRASEADPERFTS